MSQKRNIFEEVGEAQPTPAPSTGAIARGQGRGRGFARIWLMVLFAMVTGMIIVGGLTRLTDSGLSITEWAPVTGALPPMNQEDWQTEFDAYRQIDEYRLQNVGMTLEEFKYIFWWEWGHRQLGRFVGLVWAVGFFGMLATRSMPRGWAGRFLLIGGLGGLQGAIGWWMVHSGLQEGMLDVASYRLATHLGLAFLILCFIASYILRLSRSEAELLQARRNMERRLKGIVTGLLHLSFTQVLLGALVAGIDAGQVYAEWPTMGGGFFPPFMFQYEPWWRNFFENEGTVQFTHRLVGYLLALMAIGVLMVARKVANRRAKRAAQLAVFMVFLQAFLGIVTVVNASPLTIALMHLIGAIITIVIILRARHLAIYPPAQSVREG